MMGEGVFSPRFHYCKNKVVFLPINVRIPNNNTKPKPTLCTTTRHYGASNAWPWYPMLYFWGYDKAYWWDPWKLFTMEANTCMWSITMAHSASLKLCVGFWVCLHLGSHQACQSDPCENCLAWEPWTRACDVVNHVNLRCACSSTTWR